MDFLIPAIAVIVGLAILAPGALRFLKRNNSPTSQPSCGGCAGCGNAAAKPATKVQVVQLNRKSENSTPVPQCDETEK
jgi:hypothetical protein